MKKSPIDRLRDSFDKKYIQSSPTSCWEWVGAKQKDGYGYINTHGLWKNSKPAHVVSVLLHENQALDLNEKISVHHKCFNVSCVNPDHLVVMSAYEQTLHLEHTALGVLDKMSTDFPSALSEINHLKAKLRNILGLPEV